MINFLKITDLAILKTSNLCVLHIISRVPFEKSPEATSLLNGKLSKLQLCKKNMAEHPNVQGNNETLTFESQILSLIN